MYSFNTCYKTKDEFKKRYYKNQGFFSFGNKLRLANNAFAYVGNILPGDKKFTAKDRGKKK
jgi:hypothetical protein